jgi:hypothetical protein
VRKVAVGLVADVAGFIRNVTGATKSLDDLGDEVKELDAELDKIPPDAMKAAAAMKLLSGDVTLVGKSVSDLGAKSVGLSVLDAKIRESQREVRKLSDEFMKTGDLDVFKKLGDATGKLEGLKAVRTKLKDAIVGGVVDGVSNAGKGFVGFWKDALGSMGGSELKTIGITAGLIIAAAAAPVIGSAVGGALLAGAAAGPLAAGVGMAVNDPRVQAEMDKLGMRFGDTMQRSAVYFVPVVERAFQTLSQSWERLAPQVEQSFVNVSPLVDKITKGVTELAENAMPGFVKATGAAGPVFDQIENTLHAVGIEVGKLFEMLAEHPHEAAGAIQFFGMMATGAISLVTATLELLLDGWAAFTTMAQASAATMYKYFGWVPVLGEMFRKAWEAANMLYDTAHGQGATAMQSFGRSLGTAGETAAQAEERVARLRERSELLAGSMGQAASKAGTLKAALDQLNGAAISAEQAELNYQAAIDRATESIEKNGKTTDANTEKGRANREALLGIVTATQAKIDATYTETLATKGQEAADAAAAEAAKQGRQAIIAAALAMGYSKERAEEYADRLMKIPGQVSTAFMIYGTDNAEEQIQAIKDSLARVPGSKTITIKVKADLPSGISMGNLMHRASGGPVSAGTPYVVGEHEPEVFVPNMDGTIVPSLSQFASMRSTGQGAWSGGGMPRELVLNATFLDPMTGDVMRRTAIRWSLDRGRSPADFLTAA